MLKTFEPPAFVLSSDSCTNFQLNSNRFKTEWCIQRIGSTGQSAYIAHADPGLVPNSMVSHTWPRVIPEQQFRNKTWAIMLSLFSAVDFIMYNKYMFHISISHIYMTYINIFIYSASFWGKAQDLLLVCAQR